MSQDELGDVVARRYRNNGIKISDEALWKITFLSRGLPHFTHLMGMHAARLAIDQHQLMVDENTVERSRAACIAEIDQSTREKYQAAIVSQRPNETLYEPVLLACALAQCDELGRFQQTAVSLPLEKILPGRQILRRHFRAFHMNEFTGQKRHRLLERSGQAENYRYRFTDPMMQPFVILKGLQDGRINDEIAETFATRRQLRLSIDSLAALTTI